MPKTMRFGDPGARIRSQMSLEQRGTDAMDVWFAGPRFENEELFKELAEIAVEKHAAFRRGTYGQDPEWVDKSHPDYQHAVREVRAHLRSLIARLSASSIPWYSYRYHGHMNWDNSLPAIAGYIAAIFFNQNNVAAEGSPVTTELEIEVARDLCRMIGFPVGRPDRPEPWGHITCGGTVANMEALWAARNLRLYPFAVQQALRHDWTGHDDFQVTLADGRSQPLVDFTGWEVLNLPADTALELPTRLTDEEGLGEDELEAIEGYSVQRLGMAGLARRFEAEHGSRRPIDELAILAPVTAHYSMPKAASLLGLGTDNLVQVPVDDRARMSVAGLESILDDRLAAETPVAAVVVVLGSTQESAVDPLAEVIDLRQRFRARGLDFQVHADAAWGGYFAALLRPPHPDSASARLLAAARTGLARGEDAVGPRPGPELALQQLGTERAPGPLEAEVPDAENTLDLEAEDERATETSNPPDLHPGRLVYTAEMALSGHVRQHLAAMSDADTVTIDPHKAGFVPYPAGALCYRSRPMPEMIAFRAPVVYHDGEAPTVGVFGIEGSKPGAAAAAVWLSHRVIRPDQGGYGHVLGRSAFSATRLFCAIASMESTLFVLKTVQAIDPRDIQTLKRLAALDNPEFWQALHDDPSIEDLLDRIGPDLLINTFAVNPLNDDGSPNDDPGRANTLNDRVFRRLSIETTGDQWPPVILTGSEYDPAVIGRAFVDGFRARLGIRPGSDVPMRFLLTTTANPWLTDAENGTRTMVPTIARLLRDVIEDEATRLRKDLNQP